MTRSPSTSVMHFLSPFSRPACGPRLARVMRMGAGIFLVVFAAACQSTHNQPATKPAMATAATLTPFDAPKGNFAASLPPDWKKIDKGGDFVLALTPSKFAGGADDPILAVQYPTLPPHIPNFIPIGGVADGYEKDLKKRFPDLKIAEHSDAKLDGAAARHYISSFTKDAKPFREVALLAVHGDHVYVITATCPADAFDASQSAFNKLTSSWKWKS